MPPKSQEGQPEHRRAGKSASRTLHVDRELLVDEGRRVVTLVAEVEALHPLVCAVAQGESLLWRHRRDDGVTLGRDVVAPVAVLGLVVQVGELEVWERRDSGLLGLVLERGCDGERSRRRRGNEGGHLGRLEQGETVASRGASWARKRRGRERQFSCQATRAA